MAVRLCLTLPLSERGGRPKCNCRLRRVNDPASGEGVLSSVVALRDSEVAQKPGNWQVRRRPRQRKERGDQDPRPPIVVGRHASAPITAIAAKRAPVRAEAEFLNDWLTRASKRPFSAQDVVGATAICAFYWWRSGRALGLLSSARPFFCTRDARALSLREPTLASACSVPSRCSWDGGVGAGRPMPSPCASATHARWRRCGCAFRSQGCGNLRLACGAARGLETADPLVLSGLCVGFERRILDLIIASARPVRRPARQFPSIKCGL